MKSLIKLWPKTKSQLHKIIIVQRKITNDSKMSKTIRVSTWVLDTLTYYAGLKKKFISGWNMKEAEKQKNQHHHQHHHHHRHHLNHFALCVYATNIRVCNNSYIPRNTHADFINGKKLHVLFLFFFREKTTFSRHQCRLHEVNCMRENRVTSKSMYHRCCCYITYIYLRTILNSLTLSQSLSLSI